MGFLNDYFWSPILRTHHWVATTSKIMGAKPPKQHKPML